MKRSALVVSALAVLAAGVGVVLYTRTSDQNAPVLRDVGPRLVSNQTSQPLALFGAGFEPGMVLKVGAPVGRELPVTVWDERHAFARLPSGLALPPGDVQAQLALAVKSPDGAESAQVPLTLVNDAAFVDATEVVTGLQVHDAFVLSGTTDQLFVVDLERGTSRAFEAGDGPSAAALWATAGGEELLVVAHRFEPSLWIFDMKNPAAPPQKMAAPAYAAGVVVADGFAYVAEHAHDSVVAVNLETGKEAWRAEVAPNPKALALMDGGRLAVGSLQTGEVQVVDRANGTVLKTVAPDPKTVIVGGHTEKYGPYIMGGKAVRALAWSHTAQRLFVASIGPNIGPNPDRMEVSLNGGVGVIDPDAGRFLWHLGFDAGVPQGFALDDANGRLYVADPALGVVRTLDVAKLTQSPEAAAQALLNERAVLPPEKFPLVRPASDFGVGRRATTAVHSGVFALALGGDRLMALCRFTGRIAALGLSPDAAATEVAFTDALVQRQRRQGEVLFFADVGRSAMSCDACHPEGHTEGVFFEKTHPMRIYRSPTLRGVRETPPYFTPASTRSLAETAQDVGGRNRYHNPDPSPQEIEALALYTSGITPVPNPNVGEDGAPREQLTLPDGATGRTRAGLALFEQHCAVCHPAPHFTLDQKAETRGQFLAVGTPPALPLRLEQQELTFQRFAPPSLLGAWDVFPMLGTGSAGLRVAEDGTLQTTSRFPLREVVQKYSGPDHGNAAALPAQQQNDLLAYLLSL